MCFKPVAHSAWILAESGTDRLANPWCLGKRRIEEMSLVRLQTKGNLLVAAGIASLYVFGRVDRVDVTC